MSMGLWTKRNPPNGGTTMETYENAIARLREHPKYGRGTCSVVDECCDRKDLFRVIGDEVAHLDRPLTEDEAYATLIEFAKLRQDHHEEMSGSEFW